MNEYSTVLPHDWKLWIAENKLAGIEDEILLEVLVEHGFHEIVAARELAFAAAHPYFRAGQWAAQKLAKMEALGEVRKQLSSLSPRNAAVDRRRDLTRQEFLDTYYSANRPVVLLDAMQGWQCLSLWTPAYLRKMLGNEVVEIMSDRDSDPLYQMNAEAHKSKIRFSELADRVLRGPSNDYYLLANNQIFEKDNLRWMYNQIQPLPEFLNPQKAKGTIFFWFGPAGTVTPLHHDKQNILFMQVFGQKRVTLISPDQSHLLYNEIGVFSQIDCENPDLENYPSYDLATPLTVTLRPGEALFIPVGWWHHIRALSISINVSFLNFVFPNYYDIPDVHIERESEEELSTVA
jgi:ribosomal protein L16 Arg81 hydroxylase